MNSYCLYHSSCGDGFASAMVVWMRYKDKFKYIPVKYQNPVPIEVVNDNEIDQILIVDFSYPRSVLEELKEHCQGLLVIDHHDTAPMDYPGMIFDREHSGCTLTWKYLFNGIEIPELLLYVEDRDLWLFKMPFSREINLGLEQIPRYVDGVENFREWQMNLERISELRNTGVMLLNYKKKLIDEVASHAYPMNVLGYEGVICVENAAGSLTSEVGELLREKNPEAPFILIYGISQNELIVSLRGAKNEIHLGQLCQHYQGGGHKNAAGFKISINNWLMELIKS